MIVKKYMLLLIIQAACIMASAQPGRERTYIYIEASKSVSSDSSYRNLGPDIPALISLGLSRYTDLVCYKGKDTVGISKRPYYTLTSSYTAYPDQLYINASLVNNSSGEIYDLPTISGKTSALFSVFDDFSVTVYTTVSDLTKRKSTSRVVISCFIKEMQNDTIQSQDVSGSIVSYLFDQKGIVIIPQSQTNKYCDSKRTYNSILYDLKGDFLLTGRYLSGPGGITIYPLLECRDSSRAIELPAVAAASLDEAASIIAIDLSECITALVEKKYLDVFGYTADYNGYIEKAKNIMNDSLGEYAASVLLSKAICLDRDKPDAYYYMGKLREQQQRLTEAEMYYKASIDKQIAPGMGYPALGNVQMGLSNYRGSLATFKKLKNAGVSYPNTDYYIGLSYYSIGETDSARTVTNGILSTDPGNIKANILLARVYEQEKKYTEAQKYYLKAFQADSLDNEARLSLSDFYAMQGYQAELKKDISAAEKNYKASWRYYPDKLSYEYLRKFYIRAGLHTDAQQLIQKGVENGIYNKHDIFITHAQDLRTFRQKGDYDTKYLNEALSYLHVLVNGDHADTLALRYIGSTYFRLQQYDSATYYYKAVIKLKPKDVVPAWYDLAEILVMSGSYSKAQNTLDSMNLQVIDGSLPLENRALWYYFSAVCKICNPAGYPGKTFGEDKDNMSNLVKKGQPIENWDYSSFKKWAEKSSLTEMQKKDIMELTAFAETNTVFK